MSIAAIAMKHNCARSTVSGYVNQKDSTPAAGANGGMDAGKAAIDRGKIRELHAEGKSNRQVARELGISISTVFRYLTNGKTPANGARGTEAADNGQLVGAGNAARKAPLEDQIAALEALAASEWARLGLLDRLRLLISRGSA
jgi:hypothetical protein